MTIDLIELRDLQQIYQRRALAAAGMPEAADFWQRQTARFYDRCCEELNLVAHNAEITGCR